MDEDTRYQGITEFEILTAMAFSYFQKHADIAIFEAGIGENGTVRMFLYQF